MKIMIWGMYRTGTNWIGDVCKMNFDIEVNEQLDGRKHCFLTDSGTQHRPQQLWGTTLWREIEKNHSEDLHLVMAKHPTNWLDSMTRKRTSKNGVDFFIDTFGEHTEEQMLRHYNTYYDQWLQFNIPNKFILSYEEMLIEPEGVLDFISNSWDIKRKPFKMPKVGSVSQSKDLTDDRIQKYIDIYRGDTLVD